MVDGEGCLTIARQLRPGRPSPAFRVSVTVTNTDFGLLRPFKAAWGGSIYDRPDGRKEKDWASSGTWHCPDWQLKPFLEAMLPFLRGKQKQARLLLDFIAHKKSFKRYKGSTEGEARGGSAPLGLKEIAYRERVWNAVRLLNSKGRFSRKTKGR